MKPTTADALRKSELAKIHVAKKDLALPEDEYRALLLQVTGKESAADLDWQGRKKLLDHFKKIGFKVKAKAGGRARPSVGKDRAARMGKIEALLADAGRSWAYADGVAKRLFASTTGVERIEFCDGEHLAKVIAALVIDARRREKKAASAAAQDAGHAA
ncbi:MAG: regulatory protein GemA [Burkholderiaceae bacterium]|nr:regulatory protein GemA [Burkholderiaceae bacterium]